ncbi:MAG: hypothetical protein AAFN74_02990, partial [Myxococcota bacterium]
MLRSTMDTLGPELVRAAIEAVSQGPVLEAVETGTQWKFPHPDGRLTQAPIWIARTAGQLWLAAVDDEDRMVMATGNAEDVEVSRNWLRNVVKVQGRTLALGKTQLDVFSALVERFTADAGGAAYPPPSTRTAGPLAKGAFGLPPWWADTVPSVPDDPWLFGFSTVTNWTFNGPDGPISTPLIVGIRGRGQAVAAAAGDLHFAADLPTPVQTTRSFGQIRILAGDFRLDGSRLDSGYASVGVEMLNADEVGRWRMCAAHAMNRGQIEDATELWYAAMKRGVDDARNLDLATVALAVARPAHAVSLLKSVRRPDSTWMKKVDEWRRVAQRSKATGGAPASVALTKFIEDAVEAADAPGPGWPWPPEGATEAWAAAGGLTSVPSIENDPRRAQVEAALAERHSPRPVAAAAYRVAARQWAASGDSEQAYASMQSALRLESSSPDHFQAALWAHSSGDEAQFEAHIRAGMAVAPAAEPLLAFDPGADVLRKSAAVAEAIGERRTAGRLLIRALKSESAATEVRLATVRRVAADLEAFEDAAAELESIAEVADSQVDDGVAELWLEVAELWRRAGVEIAMRRALDRAVQSGFLRADVFRRAAAFDDAVGTELSAWWHHLAHVLSASSPAGTARPPAPKLSKAQLEHLHPGGEGWMTNIRSWLDAPEPPARDQITRGLERLESSNFPDVFRRVSEISERLGMRAPAIYVYRGDDAFGVSGWPVSPPVLLIGHHHLTDGPRKLEGDALTFALSVELAHLACGHPLLNFDPSLLGTSTSAYQAFGKWAETAETVVDLVSLFPGGGVLKGLERAVRISRKVMSGWGT